MKAVVVVVLAAACSRSPQPSPTATKLELADAPATGDVAPLVKAELARARAADHKLLVYIGATWCEPCNRFHDAAAAGQLDDRFGDLRLIVFDSDRDADRLVEAGYTGTAIPMFTVPRDDGTSSGRKIEGSIKGDGAVAEIAPRLRALLDGK